MMNAGLDTVMQDQSIRTGTPTITCSRMRWGNEDVEDDGEKEEELAMRYGESTAP